MSDYVPLWCKTNYSFLEGASHPEELIETAHDIGLRAVAVTDRDGVYGMVRAHVKARELGVKLICGAQLSVTAELTAAIVNEQPAAVAAAPVERIVLLAADRGGWANLCRLLSRARLRSAKGASLALWSDVCEHAGGLLALCAEPPRASRTSDALTAAFGDRLYALLTRHLDAGDLSRERKIREWALRYDVPLAAATEVLYHSRARKPLQDVLTCIRHGVTLAAAGKLITANAEHDLRAPAAFTTLFADHPAALDRTREIAARCDFSLGAIRYRYPSEQLPSGLTSQQWLRELTFSGAAKRYPAGVPADVTAQLEKELTLIERLDYPGYFLTMYEIVERCRAEKILCQGRGSAANSAVCYCLGITAIDPVRMGLLFERFLSLERAEPPDIDLDIQHERREEVIQWVYTKYRRTHAAMVANFIRYRSKSAVRDVGKALGIPEATVGRLTRLLSHGRRIDAQVIADAGLGLSVATLERFAQLTSEIRDFPRHLSIHPGGFLLGHEPVHDLVPIENATLEARTVIQWDKEDVEALGLFKVDLLGLGALSLLDRAFALLRKQHGLDYNIATIPPDDPATYAMIQRADTLGTFQIESRAQMSMLPRLRPKNFYDLVIEVSIVRPGPITGGMVHPYLRRRNGEEPVEYPHECLRPVLEKTLGVPLFQEQVMKLAVVAADYTPGEADQLRRDMAAWRRSGRIEHHRDRLISRMEKKGIAPEFAERVFNQIRGFGEYGFPESHAASFALIGYATAWLKCHYPAEFTCALLNAQPLGFYSPATIIEDAKRHDVEMRPIDVRHSEWDCTVEGAECALRIGLRYVKGLKAAAGQAIVAARNERPFESLADFARRTGLHGREVTLLAEAGAFATLDGDRRRVLWQALGSDTVHDPLPLAARERAPRFAPLGELEAITWDYDRSSHSVRGHPIGPLRGELARLGFADSRAVNATPNGKRARYAGLVICRQRPGTASGVVFMTLEDEFGVVNLVVWSRVFDEFNLIARTTSFLAVTGQVQSEEGVVHLIAEKLWRPEIVHRPAEVSSHDFH